VVVMTSSVIFFCFARFPLEQFSLCCATLPVKQSWSHINTLTHLI
jgi:hypothetical protein